MLTIILLTFNRPAFLERTLAHLTQTRCANRILVADASKDDVAVVNQGIVAGAGTLDAHYLRVTAGAHVYVAYWTALNLADTEFVVMLADDDFLVPAGLADACAFLSRHPDYGVAVGRSFMIRRPLPQLAHLASAVITELAMCDRSFIQPTAEGRVADVIGSRYRFSAPKTVYGVMRRSEAIALYGRALAAGLSNSNTERLINMLVLVAGRIKLVDCTYSIREYHTANSAAQAHVLTVPTVTDYATFVPGGSLTGLGPKERCDRILADLLAEVDGLGRAASAAVIDRWNAACAIWVDGSTSRSGAHATASSRGRVARGLAVMTNVVREAASTVVLCATDRELRIVYAAFR